MHKSESYKVMPGQEKLGSKWLDNQQPRNHLQHNRGHLCLNHSHSRQHKQSTSHRCHNCQHKQKHASRQSTENHSFDIQPRSHHQQRRQYQDHKHWHQTLITGSEKDTCGSVSTYNHVQHFTYQNNQMMGRTLNDWLQKEQQWCHQQSKQEDGGLTTIGRNQEQDHLTDNGQDQQTLRKMSSTSMSMTQTMRKKHNKHKDHEEWRPHSNQQGKKDLSTNWHTCHTDLGAQSAWRAKAEQTITQNRQADNRWYKWTSHTWKPLETNKYYQY